MSLEVINQQGAQVVALTQRVEQLQSILTLVLHDAPRSRTYDKKAHEAAETIASVNWNIARNGNVTVTVKRKDKK